jgi:hypothetical protein
VNLLFKYCHTVNTLYIKCLRLAKACRTLGDASSKTLRRLEIATGEPVRFDGPGSSINWAKVLKSVQILRNGPRPLRRACTGVAQFEGQTRLDSRKIFRLSTVIEKYLSILGQNSDALLSSKILFCAVIQNDPRIVGITSNAFPC